jgi:hypothetical protein
VAAVTHPTPKTPTQIACARIAREMATRALTPARVVAVMRLPHGTSAEDATRFVSLVAASQHEMVDATSPLWRSLAASLGLSLSDICPDHRAWVSAVQPMPRRERERDPIAEAAEAAARAVEARGMTITHLARTSGNDVRSVDKLLSRPLNVSRLWPAIARAIGVSLVELATEGGASRQVAEAWALRQPVGFPRQEAQPVKADAEPPQTEAPAPEQPPAPPLNIPPPTRPALAEAHALMIGRAILDAATSLRAEMDAARDAAIADALERSARAEAEVAALRAEVSALVARLRGAL